MENEKKATSQKKGQWKMPVYTANDSTEKCRYWNLLVLENAGTGICWYWKMPVMEYAGSEKDDTGKC